MQNGSFTWNHAFSPTFFVETVATGGRMDWSFDLREPTANQNLAPKLGVPNPFGVSRRAEPDQHGFADAGHRRDPARRRYQADRRRTEFHAGARQASFEFGWRLQRMILDVLPDRPGEGRSRSTARRPAFTILPPARPTIRFPAPATTPRTFFLGVAGSYSQTLPAPEYVLRKPRSPGYLQDNWKVTRNLTLNLGLRYDFMQPLIDSRGVNAVFDFPNHAIARQASNADLIRQGPPHRPSSTPILDRREVRNHQRGRAAGWTGQRGTAQFQPARRLRIQLAHGKRSLVVRGGYGMYRFPLETRLFNVQRGNPPLQGTVSSISIPLHNRPDGLSNWGLRSVPTVIAGTPSGANAIDPNAVNAIPRGVGINAFAPSLPTSVAREWNLTLETEIMKYTLLRFAYVGTAGRNLEQDVQTNGQPGNYVYYVTTGNALPTGAFRACGPARLRPDHLWTHSRLQHDRLFELQRRAGGTPAAFRSWSGLPVVLRDEQCPVGRQRQPDPGPVVDSSRSGHLLPRLGALDFDAFNRFINYQRDANIPKHRVNWNVLLDLPIGRGKKVLGNSGRWLDRLVGGWQLAASSSMNSRYITLPATDWGPTGQVQTYGTQYNPDDCRSGTCIQGYLYYNGYIPANQINSQNAQGSRTA